MHAVGFESAASPEVWCGEIVELEPSASTFFLWCGEATGRVVLKKKYMLTSV